MVKQGSMRRLLMSATWMATLGLAVPVAGMAQSQPYETPKYTPAPSVGLDKNYGLPTFGMPGADLPRRGAMAPETPAEDKPDFFKPAQPQDSPRAQSSQSEALGAETPLYTTSQGMTTNDSTLQGMTTDDSTGYDTGTFGSRNRPAARP